MRMHMAELPKREPVTLGFPSTERRLKLPQARRRARLMETARLLANEGGYEAVTIDAVCRRAGVARGTVYHYFSSKDHLLIEVNIQWAEECCAELRRKPPAGATLLDRIVETFRRVVDGVLREPKFFRAAFQALCSPDPAVTQMQGRLVAITAEYLEAALEFAPEINPAPLCMVLGHVFFSSLVAMVVGRVTPEMLMEDLTVAATMALESSAVCGQRPDGGREKEARQSGGVRTCRVQRIARR